MKYHLLLKFTLSLLFAAFVSAKVRSDCEKINKLGVYTVKECIEDKNGKVVKLNIYNNSNSDNISQQELNDLLLYKSIQTLVLEDHSDKLYSLLNKLPNLSEIVISKFYEYESSTPQDGYTYQLNRGSLIDDEFKLSKNLKKLTLDGIILTQAIIDEISTITNLEELNLPHCDFTNINFDSLKNLEKITKIELSGIVPQSLMDVFKKSVKTIILHVFYRTKYNSKEAVYYGMNGMVYEHLEDLTYDFDGFTNLEVLEITSKEKNINLSTLKNLPNLTKLNLDRVNISPLINSFPNLTELAISPSCSYLESNNINVDADLIPKLKNLTLATDTIPSFINNVSNLKQLTINGNILEEFIQKADLQQLEYLDLLRSSAAIEKIGELPNLEYLNLSECNVKVLPEIIFNFENLKTLNLDKNYLDSISTDIKKFVKLKNLDLSNNENLTTLPVTIGDLKNLEYLNLSSCKINILPNTFGELKNLKELNLSNNDLYMNEFPDSFDNLKNLEYLDLSLNELSSIPSQVCNLVNLKTLILGSPREPTPSSSHYRYNPRPQKSNSIKSIPESCSALKNLEILDLRFNDLSEFPSFIGEFKNLKQLSILYYNYTNDFYSYLYNYGKKFPEVCEFENLKNTLNLEGGYNCPENKNTDFDIKPDEDFNDIENLHSHVPIYIYNAGRNKCLRTTGILDSPVTFGDCDNTDNIVWFVPYSHHGYYRSKINPDYCLSIENDTEGGKIILQNCEDSEFNSFGRYENFIKPSLPDNNLCLGSSKGSDKIVKKVCNEKDLDQIWYFNIWDSTFTPPAESSIVYLYNAYKNQCIRTDGTSITTGDCFSSDETLWEIPNSHEGYYRSKVYPEKCLSIVNGKVGLNECNETTTLYLDGNFIRSSSSEEYCIATSASLTDNGLEYVENCDVNQYNHIWYFNIWTPPASETDNTKPNSIF